MFVAKIFKATKKSIKNKFELTKKRERRTTNMVMQVSIRKRNLVYVLNLSLSNSSNFIPANFKYIPSIKPK